MIGKTLGLVLTVLLIRKIQCEAPPVIEDSFIAWGEIVQPVPESDDLMFIQMSFEECYDKDTKNSALQLGMAGKNLTFVRNGQTNQTFLYEETKGKKLECTEVKEVEWLGSGILSDVLSYEGNDGSIKFSLAHLLQLPNDLLIQGLHPQGVSTTYRGIPAKTWVYSYGNLEEPDVGVSIQSYWSDQTWNTTAGSQVVPLGFNVSRIAWGNPPVTEDYIMNVFGFVPDAYDHKFFEPFEGVYCENRKSTLKFPDVKNIKAISLHSEMALPDYQELRYVDTWFDPTNQLTRVDVERLKEEDPTELKQKKYQSEIAIGKMGIVYRWGYFKGEAECKVIPFDQYSNDFQNMFNIKQDLTGWKMGKIFGLNETKYVYTGKTTKFDVPCHMFQGMRADWPDKDSKIISLWEWCFNVNMTKEEDIVMFQDGEFGLISANVIILQDEKEDGFKDFRMNLHFYEVKAQNPAILDATSFDIGRCFKDTEKRVLQFYLDVDIGDDNKHIAENATSDITFLQKWKTVIYKNAGLQPYSLRVSNVRATIDDSKVYIKFSLLDAHKDLPEKILKNELSAIKAEENLRDNINDGKVSIVHNWSSGKATTLKAAPHSVSFQIDPTFEPVTLPPIPSTTPTPSTKFPFSLRTPPDGKTDGTTSSDESVVDGSTVPSGGSTQPGGGSTVPGGASTTPSSQQKTIEEFIGHKPGAVAGVSIAMLIVGITIGSAGTFVKFNGLPSFMRK